MWSFARSLARNLLRRSHLEHDLDDEVRTHFALLVDEHRAAGLDEAAAVRAARMDLGGLEQVKDAVRDVRRGAWAEEVWRDVRSSARMLVRNRGFTAIAVLTLAVGIGVNAAVFTVTNAILFQGFQLLANDRLLYIRTQSTEHPQDYGDGISYPDFQDWRAQSRAFADIGAATGRSVSVSDAHGFAERQWEAQVSANTFALIDQRPVLGRDFAPADESPGAAPVAILSYRLWQGRYDKDPAVVGQTIRINGTPTTVIGVMAEGLSFPSDSALWVPLVPTPDLQKRDARHIFMGFGRVADGVTADRASAEMDAIGRRLAADYPRTNQDIVPVVRDFKDFFVGPREIRMYESLWGAVALLLLLACANVANLQLARCAGRAREMSVRVALGAGRWRMIRQLLVESEMLAAVGGVVAWPIAKWSVRTYELVAMPWPKAYYFAMNDRVLGYHVAIATGAGLLFGLAPALRLSSLDRYSSLKDGGRGAIGGRRRARLSNLFVVGEMALAFTLLTGAGVMIRSALNVYQADLGVKTAGIVTAQLDLPANRYPRADARISLYERLKTRLQAIGEVDSVALASRLPAGGSLNLQYDRAEAGPIDERTHSAVGALIVDPGYFRTLGAAVLAGRAFDDADRLSSEPVAIVNQQLARHLWPGENAVGKHLRPFDGETPQGPRTVVGVVSDIAQKFFDEGDNWRGGFEPLVYMPYRQRAIAGMYIVARSHVRPQGLASTIRREVQRLDPDLPMSVRTLDENLALSHHLSSTNAGVFLLFAAMALLLASVGLYAVVADSVSQRTQEIGVRMAIGATSSDILTLVFSQGLFPIGVGLLIGLVASLAFAPMLRSVLVQVSPTDPITIIGTSIVLTLAAGVGCLIPARCATRVDPVVALRHD